MGKNTLNVNYANTPGQRRQPLGASKRGDGYPKKHRLILFILSIHGKRKNPMGRGSVRAACAPAVGVQSVRNARPFAWFSLSIFYPFNVLEYPPIITFEFWILFCYDLVVGNPKKEDAGYVWHESLADALQVLRHLLLIIPTPSNDGVFSCLPTPVPFTYVLFLRGNCIQFPPSES